MAESKKNLVVHGFSGKLGKLIVFRQRDGKTFATEAPGKRVTPMSEEQLAVQGKFQQAVIYWNSIKGDDALKQEYKEAAPEGQSAFNFVIADFFRAPDIRSIDITGYTGEAGQPIRIKAVDNFKVKAVRVKIENQDGVLQEEGDAAPDPDSSDWIYTTTTANESITGDKLTITATDRPDNLSKQEMTFG